jgi:hypothetical protein
LNQETTFGVLDTRGVGILHSVERLLGDVFVPALGKNTTWGNLGQNHCSSVKQEFMNQLDSFVGKTVFGLKHQYIYCWLWGVVCIVKHEKWNWDD